MRGWKLRRSYPARTIPKARGVGDVRLVMRKDILSPVDKESYLKLTSIIIIINNPIVGQDRRWVVRDGVNTRTMMPKLKP